MENGKEPITPCTIKGRQGWGDRPTISNKEVYGLTKREYFAGLAMQSLAGLEFQSSESHSIEKAKRIAKQSIFLADELLKQLES